MGFFYLEMFCVSVAASVLGIVFLLVAFLGLMQAIRQSTWRELKKFPGPDETIPLLWSTTLHRTANALKGHVPYNVTTFQARIGMFQEYQKEGICRFYVGTFGNLAVHRADFTEIVLTHPATTSKSMDYSFLHSWLGTGLLTSDGPKWRRRRKMLTPAFHFRILEDFVGPMNVHARNMVLRLKDLKHKDFVDIVPLAAHCTLSVLLETIMGVDPESQKDELSRYVGAVQRLGENMVQRALTLWYLFDAIYYRTSKGKQYQKDVNTVHAFTMNVIEKRRKELQEEKLSGVVVAKREGVRQRRSFLDILLEQSFLETDPLTVADMCEEVDTFMFEGHDTTSSGISWWLYMIGLHPPVQEKVREELDAVLGDDYERDITQDDLKEMQYFDSVLKECQRIYPAVPVIGRNVKEDFVLDGKTVPKGTTIDIIIYALHRDPEVFPNPEEFQPERFFPENSRNRHPFAYVPFSAGPRNCIGQKYAMQEVKIVLATIIRHFEIYSVEERDKILFCSELVLKAKNGLKLRLVPRFQG
uniref:Putative p450 n=1 Tax=Ornithodoros turicata TaxID=34597 RepID=A0A2R5LGZ8_9ACAR